MWSNVKKFIDAHDAILITSHVNPDGDAIGSEVALAAFLDNLGKTVRVANTSETPQTLRFLDPNQRIEIYPAGTEVDLKDVDAAVVLDANNWEQVGNVGAAIANSDLPVACIDHHIDPDPNLADVIVTDTTAASVGVLIYELVQSMGGTITSIIAEALYATIITDTGTFRFSNTDARAMRAAAVMVDHGANPNELYRHVFGSKSWAAGRLIGPVMGTLESAADGRLAWITATKEMMAQVGAQYEDTDGFVDLVRTIKGVELVLFFKELPDGHVKVSLRSNGHVDAQRVAKSFGGGGHRMAAGMRLEGPMEHAVDTVVAECESDPAIKNPPSG